MPYPGDPTYLYSGQGIVYLAERDSATGLPLGFNDIGNVSELMLMPKVERVEHRESRTGNNSKDNVFEKATDVEVSFTCEDFRIENLKTYLYGSNTALTAGTVTSETVIGYKGKFVPLARMNVTAFTSLTNSGATTTYVAGVDYEIDIKTGMLYFPSGATFTDGASLRANYTAGAEDVVAAMTQLNKNLWLRFDGLNRANDGKPVVVDIYKCRLDPVEEIALINEEYGSYKLSGNALFDAKRSETGLGNFFRIRQKVA